MTPAPDDLSRRDFVHSAAAVSAALSFPGILRRRRNVAPIRVGLVGCGGRGTGAAKDCMTAADGIELVSLGDLFPDRLAACRQNLVQMAAEDSRLGPMIKVDDSRCFTGFDAYTRVLATDIDLVILATPPGFRPVHLAAAVAAGKHVFMEKPVAVDPTGVRSIIASADAAAQKQLAIVAGTQRRHDPGYRAVIQRLHDGAIDHVVAGEVTWNQGGLWMHARKPEWSDTEWQLRNWLYFTWLSGDHIVEQHIHNLDVANWVMKSHPVKAVGVGGRQQRTDPAYGHIYDHFAIDFEYPNGAHITSMCRQIDGAASFVGEHFIGTAGNSDGHTFIEGKTPFKVDRATPGINPYVQEHADLIASIRAGQPLNDGRQVAESTLTAIMGREAAYTGQVITWDELLNAEQNLMPPQLALGSLPVSPVAMPGRTKLARTWEG
jgi:predicted dehydrogenase